jgi:hypothetical protein
MAGSGGTSTVSGYVETRGCYFGDPIPGAAVGVYDTSLSTTSDSNAAFTLQGVPNGDVFFTTSAGGNWGIVDYYEVPAETQGDVYLGVTPQAEIDLYETELSRTISDTDSIVVISFYDGPQGGETGTISASSDDPFTFNPDDPECLPVVQPGIIVSQGWGELIFTGINPADGPITATVTGTSGVTNCYVDESPGTTYPLLAKSLTIVYAYCEPAQ